ncbi:hypothetical protein [Entomospira culicis]|uniref:Uncharacterized protein n=1 Tax=Entomospira culicis TaxID=2719989 RepID=A0A968GDX2_9SPIO|nr:hypothetical protein [Entomospira culicis]NIZ18532.1 hypothetical protein [Entomospira culicis]NIZ68748.1 hypothetical protein [Entomospira culicis]WDI37344.1 hypothetical protein PVA46_00720 [Entomospira culicis]WDI38973.1 hypothetical protein PVA47_00730 [Entomospira culicis]
MNHKARYLFLIFLLPMFLFAQASDNESSDPPRAFDNLSLGMSYDALLDALAESSYFIYRGRPDVSMLDPLDRTTIEVRGAGFVYRGFFTFYEDQLYSMSIVLHEARLDYFTLWRTLQERYGDPQAINPKHSVWENETTRLSLEQPATLKYLDKTTFNKLLDRSNTDKSALDRSRDRFLEQL